MNLDLDTWDIIDSYFRDTPHYLARHHIDSYNDFINNKIPQIIKNTASNPPFILIDKDQKSKLVYEIKVHWGGRNNDRYKLSKPTVINYPSGEVRQLYPNEARLKNITYGADFFIDIDVDFTIKRDDVTIAENVPIPNNSFLKDIYIGKIPIMVQSDICSLNGANVSGDLLTQMGEDKYDLGGYFILDGAEKVIVSQERKAENIVFLNTIELKTGSERYSHFAEVKCVSDDAFAFARTVKVQLETKGPVTVRLGQADAFLQEYNKRDVPLFIMFRALGIESDKEILEYIIGNLKGDLAEKMIDLLRPSILDPYIVDEEIYDKESAESYLVKLPTRAQQDKNEGFSQILKNKKPQLSILYSTFNETFFPHITSPSGNVNKAKAYYLGYVTRKLLLLRLGLEKDTDRDNFTNKRIDISGFLMAILFREAFREFIRHARVETNRVYTNNTKDYSGEDNIMYIINETNFNQIFDREVFKKHFNGALKIGTISQKKGIVQALDRLTRNLTIAHLRRIIDNLPDGSQPSISRRRLHGSQYGCVCPVETPEGQKVGMNKGLAIMSHITFGTPARGMIDFLIKQGIELLDDLVPTEVSHLCKVFINGNWIGCHRKPELLEKTVKLYRRNGLINVFISVAWERSMNELKIFTDGGRFVRPLYIIENNNMLLQPRHLNEIKSSNISFMDLVSGFGQRKEPYSYYDTAVKDVSIIGLDSKDELLLDKLRDKQSVIEYVDSQEFDLTRLAIGFNINPLSIVKFTHVELHPSMYLSFNAHLLPFSDHNQAVRTIYGSKYIKQGISTYTMNFNNRIDTSAHLLNYPQRPLIQGRLYNAITHSKFGQGNNLYVAIASYNYNQEDAIVGNRSALDMGLFHTSYFKQYYDFEARDPVTGEETHFYNPMFKNEIAEYPPELEPKKGKKYDKMDKYGLPKKGVFLEENDTVIGKYMKFKNEKGQDEVHDDSTSTKLGNEGSFVDKVYTWQNNMDGDRCVKVRTCQNRRPVIGDKFASRCAQKGTFGMILNKEDLPYTEDGIIPDILLDPGSYPKRMTVSQFIELLFGNLACELGLFGTYNAFEIINVEQINDILENKLGFTSFGDRILYNGKTGEQMEVKIFSGVIHYQRLKYMVDDKINTRTKGRRDDTTGIVEPGGLYTVRERQSVSGRANGGGLKIGEMERDALISHGIWGFIKESFIERCDKFIIHVSKSTGEISIANPRTGLFYDNVADGVASYQLVPDAGKKGLTPDKIMGLNMYNQKTMDYIQLVVPYTFKLLVQEMQGMMISLRFDVNKLRDILPESVEYDNVAELTNEMIDELMDDGADIDEPMYDDYDQAAGGSESELEEEPEEEPEEESDENQNGGDSGNRGDSGNGETDVKTDEQTPSQSIETQQGGNTAIGINGEQFQRANFNNATPNTGSDIATPGIVPPIIGGGNTLNTQANFATPHATPDVPRPHLVSNMEVKMNGGGEFEMEELDLSAYGGSKPEFEIKQRDDDKVIENLNAELLGIQSGGETEKMEKAINHGVQQTLNNAVTTQQPGIMFGGTPQTPQTPTGPIEPAIPANNGLNFSFNQPNASMGMQMGGNSNMMPRKAVSFNDQVKVVELDTKISEGFMYSGSKNLDPFQA
jgi:DNA-directed RNA polymerase II subunit RPB2